MRLTTKPGSSPHTIGILRIAWAKFVAGLQRLGRRVNALDHLDEAHHRRGVKKWKPTTCSGRLVASAISLIASADVLEARIAWPGVDRVELGEDRLLDRQALGHGLDDEIDVAEALVRQWWEESGQGLRRLRVGLLLGDLLLARPGRSAGRS